MPSKIFLLTGSNMGDCIGHLEKARAMLSANGNTILQASSLYITAPWGLSDQPPFYNQALEISSPFAPMELLRNLLSIESSLDRKRAITWGPRSLDIDILFYSDWVIHEPRLTIPHPRLHERRFTLVPLDEIASDFIHPVFQKRIRTLLEECPDSLSVEKVVL